MRWEIVEESDGTAKIAKFAKKAGEPGEAARTWPGIGFAAREILRSA
jgi:hypothetical protein